jgi:hypothetical protein
LIVLVRVVVALLSFIAITAFLSMLEEEMAPATKSDTVRARHEPGRDALASLVADYTPVMPMGDCPPTSVRKRCGRIGGPSQAKVDRFDWYSDSPGGYMN